MTTMGSWQVKVADCAASFAPIPRTASVCTRTTRRPPLVEDGASSTTRRSSDMPNQCFGGAVTPEPAAAAPGSCPGSASHGT